uniref:Ovule protein n=1 Tax=Panagrolaimus sp. PS1159 TaxID=55785 RepID=A0AC35FBN0_9BILA
MSSVQDHTISRYIQFQHKTSRRMLGFNTNIRNVFLQKHLLCIQNQVNFSCYNEPYAVSCLITHVLRHAWLNL